VPDPSSTSCISGAVALVVPSGAACSCGATVGWLVARGHHFDSKGELEGRRLHHLDNLLDRPKSLERGRFHFRPCSLEWGRDWGRLHASRRISENPLAASDAAEGTGPLTSPPWPSVSCSGAAASGASATLDEPPVSAGAAATDAVNSGTSGSKTDGLANT
jgi:hypothetical protein